MQSEVTSIFSMSTTMKKIHPLAGVSAALIIFSSTAFAQQPMIPPPPMLAMNKTITVLASGSAGAAANRVTLGLTVSSANPTATGIFVKQDDVLKHLKEALENAGIEASDITEQPFRLMPNMEYGQSGTRIIGYRLDTPLDVQLDNPKDLARIIDLATQSGASAVNVEGFSAAPGHSLHTEAVKNAIANAREEATAIAKEMGKTVGDIISISETGDENAAPAAAKGEEEEEREEGQRAKAQQQTNTLSEKAELKVEFEVR